MQKPRLSFSEARLKRGAAPTARRTPGSPALTFCLGQETSVFCGYHAVKHRKVRNAGRKWEKSQLFRLSRRTRQDSSRHCSPSSRTLEPPIQPTLGAPPPLLFRIQTPGLESMVVPMAKGLLAVSMATNTKTI